MSQAPSLIDQLRDIHTPEPISWWPLAPGWWILIALVTLLLILIGRHLWKITRPHPALKTAQNELEKIKCHQFSVSQLDQAAQLLRRCLLVTARRQTIASNTLLKIASELKDIEVFPLTEQEWRLLDNTRYAPRVSLSRSEWQTLLNKISVSIEIIFEKNGRLKTQSTLKDSKNV